MPGLPWVVKITEAEIKNSMNPVRTLCVRVRICVCSHGVIAQATKYVNYHVTVRAFGWHVERRFSDFDWLRQHLIRGRRAYAVCARDPHVRTTLTHTHTHPSVPWRAHPTTARQEILRALRA
jgi:hypothetical protein